LDPKSKAIKHGQNAAEETLSGNSDLNILLVMLRFGAVLIGAASGGVVPRAGVPTEPGDFRDGALRGSAEC